MSTRPFVLLTIGAAIASCNGPLPRESQVLLFVQTDAPLPTPNDQDALFDRLTVEIFAPGAALPCANCVESFALDEAQMSSKRASFGVVMRPDVDGYRARLTLFGARGMAPRASSSIVHVRSLPRLREGELFRAHAIMRVSELARPVGTLAAPVPLDAGEGTVLGRWPEADPRACDDSARADEACIAGGAFFMGDPRLDIAGFPDQGGRAEHLVVVDPFFVDLREVTVAELRDSKVALRDDAGRIYDPSEDLTPACTYREAPGDHDALPVTCVSQIVAGKFCANRGKRLPTEAELERAANAMRAWPWVWGVDAPACDDAVFARGERGRCSSEAGPRPPGSGKRDRLRVAGGEVVDLAGNVSEWVQDLWNRDDEACFGEAILRNPVCRTPSAIDGLARVVRGGNWADDPLSRSAARNRTTTRATSEGVSDRVGFRCARSAKH